MITALTIGVAIEAFLIALLLAATKDLLDSKARQNAEWLDIAAHFKRYGRPAADPRIAAMEMDLEDLTARVEQLEKEAARWATL